MINLANCSSLLSIALVFILSMSSAEAQTGSLNDALTGFSSKDKKTRRRSLKQLRGFVSAKLSLKEKTQLTKALLRGMKDRDEDIRAESYQAFPDLGKNSGREHLAALFNGLTDSYSSVARASKACIQKVGASSGNLPFLQTALKNKSWVVRKEAAQLIGKLGKSGRPALSQLILGTLDSDTDVQKACRNALNQVGVDESVILPLVRLLGNKSWSIRRLSIQLITKLREKGRPAYGALVRGMGDSDQDVKTAIKSALAGMTATPRIVTSLLIDFKKLSNQSKVQVLRELVELHSRNELSRVSDKLVRSVCKDALQSSSWKTRQQAAKTLGSFGPRSRWCFTALLIRGKQDSDGDVKKACNAAVAAIGIDVVHIPEMIKLLSASSWSLRKDAAQYLGILGPKARAAYPALVKIRGDRDQDVRAAVKKALMLIGNDPVTLKSLLKTFPKQDPKGKEQILTDLSKLANSGKPLNAEQRQVFQWGLRDQSWTVRRRAAQSLEKYGKQGRWAYIPLLIQSYNDNDEDVRKACASAIQSIGFDDQHAGQIVALLSHRKWSLRRAGIKRLARLGSSSPSAYLGLLKCCADNDQDVRDAAEKALTKIGIELGHWNAVVSEFPRMKDKSQLRYLKDLTTLYERSKIRKPIPGPIRKLLSSAQGDNSWTVRQQSCKALTVMGSEARWAFISLIQLSISESDTDVKASAVTAYQTIGAEKSHVPALAKLIGSSHWKARRIAIGYLGSLGQDALPALGKVVGALRDTDTDVRSAALHVLPRIDPKGIGPTALKVAATLKGSESDRIKALKWLRSNSTRTRVFIPILLSSLNGKWTKLTRELADTLDSFSLSEDDYEWALSRCSEMCQLWMVQKLGRTTIIRKKTKTLLGRYASRGKSPGVRAAANKYLGKN